MRNYDLPKHIAKAAMCKADDELYTKHMRGEFDDGDPNHPKYNNGYNYATGKFVSLFGYAQDTLLAKQYCVKGDA